jgi:TIR domain
MIANRLKERGLLPWLDEWELQPGMPWQRSLEEQIANVNSAAVFVGSSGIGPWQQHEQEAFLRQFVKRKCPVMPVMLRDAPKDPRLPAFLDGMMSVDFRRLVPDPLDQLIKGITGQRKGLRKPQSK